jgi:hypothetical protein
MMKIRREASTRSIDPTNQIRYRTAWRYVFDANRNHVAASPFAVDCQVAEGREQRSIAEADIAYRSR